MAICTASGPYEVQRNTGNRSHEIPDSACSIQATRFLVMQALSGNSFSLPDIQVSNDGTAVDKPIDSVGSFFAHYLLKSCKQRRLGCFFSQPQHLRHRFIGLTIKLLNPLNGGTGYVSRP